MSRPRPIHGRLTAALLAGALLCSVSACGGAARTTKTSANSSSSAAPSESTTATTTSAIPRGQAVRGDGDADNPSDIDGNGDSDSAAVGGPDSDNDNPTPQSYRFPDSDDRASFAYGQRPSAAARRAIASVVERYYADAARADGADACTLLTPGHARSLPESFGRDFPGAKTCAAVLARLFAQDHAELAGRIELFAVRVEGESAKAIFSSRTLPASSVFLTGRGDSWRLAEVLSQPLP